mgnify:CR=1 FL=1
MDPKPILGVPADRRIIDPHPSHVVGEKYLTALIDIADALPLLIPVLAEHLDIDEVLEQIDGILLPGSYSMIEPHHYDGDPAEPGTLLDPHRDEMVFGLARRALDHHVPILAVCRGFQEMNVLLGGTLHQKVHEVEGLNVHVENKDDPLDVQYGPSHPVALVDGGLLRRLMGYDSVMVNSLHEQGIRRLADGVTVEAIADDGLIEAFSVDEADSFALAVQWHPEWKAADNELSVKLFKAFGDACRARARERQVKA